MTERLKPLHVFAIAALWAFFTSEILVAAPIYTFVPDTGATAVRMRTQELASGLRVLVLSLRPGDEDLTTLAYLRFGAGAQVLSCYVTNGESGEHDAAGVLPRELAAIRRNATAAALGRLETEVRFLNFPDPGNVAGSAGAQLAWPIDSLRTALEGLITTLKPHMILLARDWEGGPESVLWREVSAALRDLTSKPPPRKSTDSGVIGKERNRWTISRILVDDGRSEGFTVSGATVSPVLGISYRDIAKELEPGYSWQQVQRSTRDQGGMYSPVAPGGKKRFKRLEEGIATGMPQDLQRLDAVLRSYGRDVQKRRLPRTELLRRTMKVMDSVDAAIGSTMDRTGVGMRVLVDWKGILENLRNALLGVTVTYALSEDVLTERQLTQVTIQSVTGRGQGGSTELYFPSTERGWILNESGRSRIPLKVPGEYRIVTPKEVAYDLPWTDYAMERPVTVRPVMLFLLHKGATREENFVYRIALPIHYGPRLMTEVLTPLVRCIPGEVLVTRLTNNIRDGLRDTLSVNDSLVHAQATVVRLNVKGLSQTDTLQLSWRDSIAPGTFLVPLHLGGIEVARFGARKFDAAVDTSLSVALLTAVQGSPTADALRRLECARVRVVRDASGLRNLPQPPDVVIVDRRYTSLASDGAELRPLLDAVARRGGHVIVLSQDASAWNASPLWDVIRLRRDPALEPRVPVSLDAAHPMVRTPNAIDSTAFQDWVFASGYNRVSVTAGATVETPLRYDAERPLLVTAPVGSGRLTYVELALAPQWMSIHPGAFRILANLLSMRAPREGPHE